MDSYGIGICQVTDMLNTGRLRFVYCERPKLGDWLLVSRRVDTSDVCLICADSSKSGLVETVRTYLFYDWEDGKLGHYEYEVWRVLRDDELWDHWLWMSTQYLASHQPDAVFDASYMDDMTWRLIAAARDGVHDVEVRNYTIIEALAQLRAAGDCY